jgi:hypothetical protein
MFHFLGHVTQYLFGNLWILAAPRSQEFIYLREVINFSSGSENHALLLKPGQKLVTFARGCDLRKRRYDVAAAFKIPNERWNGVYQSAPGRTKNFEFPTCACASDHQASNSFSTF